MNKYVVSGQVLLDKMENSIDLLCNTVKSTLGPSGNNVIVSESSFSPFITNDGVTIAQNIESTDACENAILTLAKEASIKTGNIVGDGTTTTLVLLQSMFNGGLKLVKEGYNTIKLKKEIEESIKIVINELKSLKRDITKEDIKLVASVSGSDKIIGEILSAVYEKTSLIKINESASCDTKFEIVNGYVFDTTLASTYFLNNKKEIYLSNVYILISEDIIESVYDLQNIINEIEENKSLLIIAEDFDSSVINEMVMQNFQKTLNVVLVKASLYGQNKVNVLNDISILTGTRVFSNNFGLCINDAKVSNFGIAKEVKIDNKTTTIIDGKGKVESINNLKEFLKNEINLCENEYEKELIDARLAGIDKGVGIISVGAVTDTERKELKMRYEDALCAINSCKEGVLVGSGLSLLKLQSLLGDNVIEIVKDALSVPFLQIIENMGLDKENVLKNIKDSKYGLIFNGKTYEYESVNETSILDPFLVVKSALLNASSIASMLLTTKYLVINETQNNLSTYMKNENNPY